MIIGSGIQVLFPQPNASCHLFVLERSDDSLWWNFPPIGYRSKISPLLEVGWRVGAAPVASTSPPASTRSCRRAANLSRTEARSVLAGV